LAGALTGVVVATKYPAVVVAVLVPFAVSLGRLAALAAAFVTSPYLFLDFVTVPEEVQKEMLPTYGVRPSSSEATMMLKSA
jgi:hypothetical protein